MIQKSKIVIGWGGQSEIKYDSPVREQQVCIQFYDKRWHFSK